MLKFDKLKIVSDIENIEILKQNDFDEIVKNNYTVALKFYMTYPFHLYIEIDYVSRELVIEFTGKILGVDYPKLISLDNIRQCFENINKMGLCYLNIDAIISDSKVVKCDVTKDCPCDDISTLTAFIRSNISNYYQFSARQLRNGNFIVEKNVTSKQSKKRLTIYDKSKQMNKSENKKFMENYNIEPAVFDGLCRFEMNLNSVAQIKSSLDVPDTNLLTVLSATKNPIQEFMNDVVADTDASVPLTDKQSYFAYLVLQDCNYDLAQVEAKMRQFYSKNTYFARVMQPYREALNRMSEHQFTKKDLLNMLS